MANKENLPPTSPRPLISSISPSNKPALNRQRDHSACRRPDSPLKVRKTRENLKQQSIYGDVPPPCLHMPTENETRKSYASNDSNQADLAVNHVVCNSELSCNDDYSGDPGWQHSHPAQPVISAARALPPTTGVQRRKSAGRRMFSRVKQGIASRSKAVQSIRPAESETSLMRRLSGRRQLSVDAEQRAHSFEISRSSIDSFVDESSDSLNSVPTAARSFTGSTVSTADVFGDGSISEASHPAANYFDKPMVLDLSQICRPPSPPCSSPTPQQTPKPPRKISSSLPTETGGRARVVIPSIELDVAQDCETLDVHAKRAMWIAITATVRARTVEIDASMTNDRDMPDSLARLASDSDNIQRDAFQNNVCGSVTTLRLCYKTAAPCRVRDLVGRKTFKDLKIGQQCNLFVRVHVPRIRARTSGIEPDPDSLFTELESMIGTLEMDMLQLEARYRHSMLPVDNVVTIQHLCKIQRPKVASRWSMASAGQPTSTSTNAQKRLARYIVTTFSPNQALELLHEYIDNDVQDAAEIREIRKSLQVEIDQLTRNSNGDSKPAVIVTDIDWNLTTPMVEISEQFSTPPTTPTEISDQRSRPQSTAFNVGHKRQPSSISLFSPTTLAPPLISTPKTTTALSISASQSSSNLNSTTEHAFGPQDTARQLWRHIRRTSLSAKQLAEITADRVESLEAGDETLREMRRRALANKRSVGAETLKGWKWDESKSSSDGFGEAPWM